jgi:hypothetical protein
MDLCKDEDLELKANLTGFAAIHKEIRFAYIYTLREGKIYFIADSEQ